MHGAFVDGSGWRAVHDILEKDGYHVSIVQEPLTGLADDVTATKRIVDLQDGPVVLVGHSYGGSVISIAGTDPKVSRLVYVAALQPDVGETAGQLLSKFPERNKAVQPAGNGYLRLDPAKFPAAYAADVAPAEFRFMADSQLPIAASVFSAPTTAAAWHSKPSYAILTTRDIAANPDLQHWMYERSGAKVTTVAASNAVHISHPKIVARVIEEAAENSAARATRKVDSRDLASFPIGSASPLNQQRRGRVRWHWRGFRPFSKASARWQWPPAEIGPLRCEANFRSRTSLLERVHRKAILSPSGPSRPTSVIHSPSAASRGRTLRRQRKAVATAVHERGWVTHERDKGPTLSRATTCRPADDRPIEKHRPEFRLADTR